MKTRAAFTKSSTIQSALLALAAVVMLVPAYALPVMHLGTFGQPTLDTTIMSGVIQLWQDGLAGLAVIVFTASFLVPLLKLAGLTWLIGSTVGRPTRHAKLLTKVYAT